MRARGHCAAFEELVADTPTASTASCCASMGDADEAKNVTPHAAVAAELSEAAYKSRLHRTTLTVRQALDPCFMEGQR